MSAIAFGQRLFGRVDTVGRRYYVATLCWHFCYLPLVPAGTFIVLRSSMQGMNTTFDGIRIPFSLKSWLIGWLRVILIPVISLLTFTAIMVPFIDSPQNRVNWDNYWVSIALPAAVGVILLATYLTPGIGRATRARAAALQQWVDAR